MRIKLFSPALTFSPGAPDTGVFFALTILHQGIFVGDITDPSTLSKPMRGARCGGALQRRVFRSTPEGVQVHTWGVFRSITEGPYLRGVLAHTRGVF